MAEKAKMREKCHIFYQITYVLMRIRMNLPSQIENFLVHNYVEKWIAAGHWRADDINSRKKRYSTEDMDDGVYDEEGHFLDGSVIFWCALSQIVKSNDAKNHPKWVIWPVFIPKFDLQFYDKS